MIRIRPAVIVEGKYDKIKLSGLLDTLIRQGKAESKALRRGEAWGGRRSG